MEKLEIKVPPRSRLNHTKFRVKLSPVLINNNIRSTKSSENDNSLKRTTSFIKEEDDNELYDDSIKTKMHDNKLSMLEIDVTPDNEDIFQSYKSSPMGESISSYKDIFKEDSSRIFPIERLISIGKGSTSIVYKSIHLSQILIVAEKVIIAIDPEKRSQLVCTSNI
jgi:hypothetical protein